MTTSPLASVPERWMVRSKRPVPTKVTMTRRKLNDCSFLTFVRSMVDRTPLLMLLLLQLSSLTRTHVNTATAFVAPATTRRSQRSWIVPRQESKIIDLQRPFRSIRSSPSTTTTTTMSASSMQDTLFSTISSTIVTTTVDGWTASDAITSTMTTTTATIANAAAITTAATTAATTTADITSNMWFLFQNPVTLSVVIMGTIISLLFVWETILEIAREKVPSVVEDVIDQVLAEMGSLGFIGLFLDTFVVHQPNVRETLLSLSENVLGDEELVLETFEFLHTVFFQTAILFFAGSAVLIVKVIDTIGTVADLADEAIAEAETQQQTVTDGTTPFGSTTNLRQITNQSIMGISVDCDPSTIEETKTTATDHDARDLMAILLLEEAAKQQPRSKDGTIQSNNNNNVWQRELSLTMKQRGAEAVIIRERLIREMGLTDDFRISDYVKKGGIFSKSNDEGKEGEEENEEGESKNERFSFVEISPSVWIPLIPSIALSNALDLSHDVVNAESANAVASSGYFVSTPWIFWPTLLTQVVTLLWGLSNYYKMAAMKQMLLPGLVEVESTNGATSDDDCSNDKKKIVLCAPMVEDDVERKDFSENRSTPVFLRWFEESNKAQPTNRIEELYGVVGGNGSEFYFESIKFHLWKCATGWIAFSQILPRDLYALSHPSDLIGAPDYLVTEIAVFSLFVILDLFQATVLVPTTTLNYCIISTVEDFVSKEAEKQSKDPKKETTDTDSIRSDVVTSAANSI